MFRNIHQGDILQDHEGFPVNIGRCLRFWTGWNRSGILT